MLYEVDLCLKWQLKVESNIHQNVLSVITTITKYSSAIYSILKVEKLQLTCWIWRKNLCERVKHDKTGMICHLPPNCMVKSIFLSRSIWPDPPHTHTHSHLFTHTKWYRVHAKSHYVHPWFWWGGLFLFPFFFYDLCVADRSFTTGISYCK